MGNLVKQVKEETVDKVEERIKEFVKHGGLEVPENYHVGNALKSAWLNLQTVEISKKQGGGLAIEKCTQESVINSLLDMVVQGLSVAKKQGYFIAYNDQLSFQRSYFGTLAVTKRLSEVKDVRYQVIYDDDIFEIAIKDGEKIISRHETNLDNIDNNKIIGAYVIIVKYDGTFYTEIMKMQDIKQSWKQSRTAWAIFEQEKDRTLTDNLKADSVHGKFTDQMVLKTVINRACKNFANTNTSDNDIFIDAVNRTTDNEFLRDGETLPEPIN